MSTETEVAPLHDGSQESFATTMLGLDPSLLSDEPETEPEAEPVATVIDAEPEADVAAEGEDPDEAVGDVVEPDATGDDGTTEDPEEEDDVEVVKLPFAASAEDADVDPKLLSNMKLKFKADGGEVEMPLADVVRRAQSEPAAQRQVRTLSERVKQFEQDVSARDTELASVRDIALKMARDPDFYAQVVEDVEQYDQPEARAQRAEQTLAERSRQEQERREMAERTQRLEAFAANEVAPTLTKIVTDNTLVTQEEIFGKFVADTASITVNGVIPPEYHESVARYLRTELAEFATERQAKYAAREAKAKAEEAKTQRERQKMKNQQASNTKPAGASGGIRDTAKTKASASNIEDASKSALDTLLSGLA